MIAFGAEFPAERYRIAAGFQIAQSWELVGETGPTLLSRPLHKIGTQTEFV